MEVLPRSAVHLVSLVWQGWCHITGHFLSANSSSPLGIPGPSGVFSSGIFLVGGLCCLHGVAEPGLIITSSPASSSTVSHHCVVHCKMPVPSSHSLSATSSSTEKYIIHTTALDKSYDCFVQIIIDIILLSCYVFCRKNVLSLSITVIQLSSFGT